MSPNLAKHLENEAAEIAEALCLSNSKLRSELKVRAVGPGLEPSLEGLWCASFTLECLFQILYMRSQERRAVRF